MNRKPALNLPKTDFPMKADLVKREPLLLERWEREKLYAQIQDARKKDAKKKFILHDGPPFANGDAHMGTALNKILKDIIIKSKTMMGFYAPYVPGWDCHGLPIEYKVVKSQGNLSPLQVRQKSEEFARKYIDIQRRQFKRLGVLGDWEKPYLTLDKKYEADILRVFARMAGKGLVYQSKKPVFWSTGAQTALAEAEVEYLEKESPAVYVKFEVMGRPPNTFVAIWTTTPWTLPANLAVAVHPRLKYAQFKRGDEKIILCSELPVSTYEKLGVQPIPGAVVDAASLLKMKLRHPFLDREVPVLSADFVASDTGTGCVHIAPGHGHDDYNLARHLGLLSPVDDEGRFTSKCGVEEWTGQYVFDANKDVIGLLRSKDRLIAEEMIRHTYPHCWRSKTPVIFRAVDQWFIKVDVLKSQALKAIDQDVEWIPEWGKNRIRGTVESRSDWCISRQRAWGVPLPIFYRANGEAILDEQAIHKLADLVEKQGTNLWFESGADELAAQLDLPSGMTRRNDTLDVWIDSGSSHAAVLKRHPELDFPADLYLEGSDQHRGWFQSSLLISVAVNDGKAPYRSVVTNGFLVDLDGKKISKSVAYEKPKDAEAFINKYGADIVRLWVASENYQNDVPLSEEIFKRIGDTYRSIRNTFRILLGNLYDFDPGKDAVPLDDPLSGNDRRFAQYGNTAIDRWMLSKLQGLVREVCAAYNHYEFHKVYHAINTFCAVEISARYVDITKDRLYCDPPDSPRRRATQTVMWELASALARLLAPILSFTAEEAWGFLKKDGASVHLQNMPGVEQTTSEEHNPLRDQDFGLIFLKRMEVSEALEKARQSKKIGKSIDARVRVPLAPNEKEVMQGHEKLLAEIFIVSQVEFRDAKDRDDRPVDVLDPMGKKCGRCWRWDETVGADAGDPDWCERCVGAERAHAQRRRN